MTAEVLIPWVGGCPHRERARRWIAPRYRWPVTLAHGSEPWSKGEALRPAIEASFADVVVVADADVWTDGIESAVRAVTCGVAEWAVPHAPEIRRLTEQATERVLAGESWERQPLDEPVYPGVVGGGIVVATREVLLDVPMDPRFVGFAREDYSWGLALRTLIGEPWRGTEPLVHLWHPPQERLDRKWGSVESRRLGKRYVAVQRNPEGMRELLNEIK